MNELALNSLRSHFPRRDFEFRISFFITALLLMVLLFYSILFAFGSSNVPFGSVPMLVSSTVFFFFILLTDRLCGIGVFLSYILALPMGGGVQPLNFIFHDIPIPYYEIWVLILLNVWIIDRLLSSNTRLPVIFKRYYIFNALLSVMVVIGVIHGNGVVPILHDCREISYFFIIAMVIPDYIKSDVDIERVMRFCLMACIASVILFYCWYMVMSCVSSSVLNIAMEKYEAAGFRIEYRLTYSIPSMLMAIVACSFIIEGKISMRLLGAFLIIMPIVVLKQGRTDIAKVLAGISLLYLGYNCFSHISMRKVIRVPALLAGFGISGIIIASAVGESFIAGVFARISTLFSLEYIWSNIGARIYPLFGSIGEASRIDLLIGKGFGTLIYIPWFHTMDFKDMNRYMDNLWATMFIKGGILGLCAVCAFFFPFIKMCKVNIKKGGTMVPLWMAFWVFGWLSFTGTFAVFYDAFTMLIFGFVTGALIARIRYGTVVLPTGMVC